MKKTAHVRLTLTPSRLVFNGKQALLDQYRSYFYNEPRQQYPPSVKWTLSSPRPRFYAQEFAGDRRTVPGWRTTQHPASMLLFEAGIEPSHRFMTTLYNLKRKEWITKRVSHLETNRRKRQIERVDELSARGEPRSEGRVRVAPGRKRGPVIHRHWRRLQYCRL